MPKTVSARRPGDPPALVAAAERARQVLGWAPRYTELRPIIETAWNWHRTHPRGSATFVTVDARPLPHRLFVVEGAQV